MTTADRSISAYFSSLCRMAALVGGSAVETAPGILLVHTGVRLPTFNGVFVRDREPDWEAVEAAVREYVPSAPWSVTLRAHPTEPVARAAADAGLTSRTSLPLLVRPLDSTDSPTTPPEVGVSVGEARSAAYGATLAAGFGIPADVLESVSGPDVLSDPHFRSVLVEDRGVPVASGLVMLEDDIAGIANIATVPQARRRGFGTLATLAAMAEGYARGARTAYLQASPDGLALYQKLGFSGVEKATVLLAG